MRPLWLWTLGHKQDPCTSWRHNSLSHRGIHVITPLLTTLCKCCEYDYLTGLKRCNLGKLGIELEMCWFKGVVNSLLINLALFEGVNFSVLIYLEEPSNSQVVRSSRRSKGDAIDHDPMDYCDHIQREMKRTKHRLAMEKIEAEMTEEQKEEERQAQRQQLEEIFSLMQNHREEFGLSSVDEIQEQMKLYISNWVILSLTNRGNVQYWKQNVISHF